MKKLITLCCLLALAACVTPALAQGDITADLFRYLPTVVTINGDELVVEGYFVNLSGSTISNLREFEMEIYIKDTSIVDRGSFSGDGLTQFSIAPYSVSSFKFTYTYGGVGLDDGVYTMDESCWADFSCRFSYR